MCRGRGAQQPGQVFRQRGDDLGRWRKPGIEHISSDNGVPPLKVIELWPDGAEKRATMIASWSSGPIHRCACSSRCEELFVLHDVLAKVGRGLEHPLEPT